VWGVLALVLTGCREWPEPTFGATTHEIPNVMLGELHDTLYDDFWGVGGETIITDDVEFSGRVVSSSREGNFHNTFFIDDTTGGAEVMAGMANVDAIFHPGQRVVIRGRGVAVGWRDGVMQIGMPPEPGSGFATSWFYHSEVMRRWVTAERDIAVVEPVDVSIDDLSMDLCGRLVRISGIAVDPLSIDPLGSITWAVFSPQAATGYVKFRAVGSAGRPGGAGATSAATAPPAGVPADSITIVTTPYALWARQAVPRGELSITGILLHGRGGDILNHFMLKPRCVEDIGF
jgi:hypothetical protein